jgi:hypothetical protein
MENADFAKCKKCNTLWKNRNDFITDTEVEIFAYQVHFENLKEGLFLFNHSCGDTIALKAAEFSDLYTGKVFDKSQAGTENCGEHCMHANDLDPCPAACECAYVREIIQIIKNS